MNLRSTPCGIVVDYDTCVSRHGEKQNHWGRFTKCPLDGCCVYAAQEAQDESPGMPFDDWANNEER